MEIPKCNKCDQEATLVMSAVEEREAWVCHDCQHFLGWKPEVYSRVVGYLRPVKQWNKGKKQEFKDREIFNMPKEKV